MKKKWIAFIAIITIMNCKSWSQNVFVHQTTSGNTNGHITNLSLTDRSSLLFITQQFGKYNNHQVGVWHNGTQWTIYNEDRTSLVPDTYFTIAVVAASANAYVHVANAGNITSNYTFLDNAYCNNNPNAIIMVTQNFNGVYNTSPAGVWYTGGRWAIFNQDLSAMPKNAAFNVWIVNPGTVDGFSMNGVAFKHTVSALSKDNNANNHISDLGVPTSNSILLATQNWGTRGPYNNHHPGVWWNGKSWTVYNQDRFPLTEGVGFNIISFTPREIDVPAVIEIEAGASYRLTTQWLGDGKSLDILNDGTNNHPWLADSGPYSGQYWILTPVGNGFYRLTTGWLGPEKSLDIISDGSNDKPVMSNSGAFTGQFWKLTSLPGGFVRLTTQWLGDGKSLDVINDGTNNQVIMAETANISGQYWKLTRL